MRNIGKVLFVSLIALFLIGGTSSCNSKKKMLKQEYEMKLQQAKDDLNAIINDQSDLTLDQQIARIEEISNGDFNDPELNELIEYAKLYVKLAEEEKLKKERRAEEERLRMEELNNIPKTSLEDYFGKIAGASSISSANSLINEALELFASPDAIVLIRINSFGDYDRPTTAVEYLNYLKDSKEAKMRIYEAKYDDNNKITELELIKK